MTFPPRCVCCVFAETEHISCPAWLGIPEALAIQASNPVGRRRLPALLAGTGMIGQHSSRAHS